MQVDKTSFFGGALFAKSGFQPILLLYLVCSFTMMQWFGSLGLEHGFLLALAQVMFINIIMSGDNAVMIGMSTQTLRKKEKTKAIFRGVAGAAIMRIIFALLFIQLLDYPPLKVIGALMLFRVAAKLYKQLRNNEETQKEVHGHSSFWHALGLIFIADLSMSLDNVLAIAAAAGDYPIAMISGIVISVFLMTTIATAISRLLERYAWVQWLGFAFVVFIAFKLLFSAVELMIPYSYQSILFRLIGMVGTFGMIRLHRKYMTAFEHDQVTRILYEHAPFIVTVLLLIVAAFLMYGEELHDRLDMHRPVWYTIFTCIFLLALEMASLERVKHRVKIKGY